MSYYLVPKKINSTDLRDLILVTDEELEKYKHSELVMTFPHVLPLRVLRMVADGEITYKSFLNLHSNYYEWQLFEVDEKVISYMHSTRLIDSRFPGDTVTRIERWFLDEEGSAVPKTLYPTVNGYRTVASWLIAMRYLMDDLGYVRIDGLGRKRIDQLNALLYQHGVQLTVIPNTAYITMMYLRSRDGKWIRWD